MFEGKQQKVRVSTKSLHCRHQHGVLGEGGGGSGEAGCKDIARPAYRRG